jgi:hypothetical protein
MHRGLGSQPGSERNFSAKFRDSPVNDVELTVAIEVDDDEAVAPLASVG